MSLSGITHHSHSFTRLEIYHHIYFNWNPVSSAPAVNFCPVPPSRTGTHPDPAIAWSDVSGVRTLLQLISRFCENLYISYILATKYNPQNPHTTTNPTCVQIYFGPSISFACLGQPTGQPRIWLATCRAKNVALQVAIFCYYHLCAQQIFMLQKVDAISIFATRKFVVRRGGNTGNKQTQLATQHLLPDKLQENVACITWP